MAKLEVREIILSLSSEELELIKTALQYHIGEEYSNETEMSKLLNDLRK
ncbi:hypothetical protein [Streptomyces sp. NBC_00197]